MAKILSLFNSEYDLARAIKRGEKKAQTLFFDSYSGLMLAICMRYLGDRMLAEDVMLQGFMKVFEKIDQFNFKGSFEGWVKRIIINEALMKLRSQKNIYEIDLDDAPQVAGSMQEYTLEEEDLMNLIKQLPTGYRTVFNLYALEGYSHAEIAERLGISEGTSKSQLSRARAILQQQLNQMNDRLTNFEQ
jgi:RNA polymerase sigma-70 factor (ECF subfamily)